MNKFIIALLSLFLIVGCSGVDRDQYLENKKKWFDSGIKNYSITYVSECYCDDNGKRIFNIIVNGHPKYKKRISIKKLFAMIDSKILENENMDIYYDNEYGYPKEINYPNNEGADGSYKIKIIKFEAL